MLEIEGTYNSDAGLLTALAEARALLDDVSTELDTWTHV